MIQVSIEGADSLLWIMNDGYNQNIDLSITSDASYQFVNKSINGCYSDTIEYAIAFGQTPLQPSVNTLSNDSLQIIGDATTYMWYLADGNLIATETDSKFEPTERKGDG